MIIFLFVIIAAFGMDEMLVKEGEGLRLQTYKCTEGYPTIGFGHQLLKSESHVQAITKERAEELLAADLKKARSQVLSWFGKTSLDQMGPTRAAVLVDMAFNLGTVRWPKLTKAIQQQNYKQAAAEIMDSKYAGQVGMRAVRNAQIMKQGKFMTKQQAQKRK